MRQSELFTKSERSAPKDEVSLNAKLLTRAGFIRKMSAGVYAYLPLGWRVIEKISRIVREEMNAIGGQEMFMPALVEKKYLDATKRWDVEIGFEVKGKKEKNPNFTLGWTHEEVLSAIAARYVHSYKDLPFSAYQIQTKFRNEARAQAGLLRGREFLMKDLYSFHDSEKDLFTYYEKVKKAYMNVFIRCGVKAVYTVAPGGPFTVSNTHEFQVLSDVGEDSIFVCTACEYAENTEISKLAQGGKCPKCKGEMRKVRAIEVGNIFPLGTKYSEAFGLNFLDKSGKSKPVIMGSYGIGISRLMGTAVEVLCDEKGMRWPAAIAPFAAHLVELNGASAAAVYRNLQKAGVEVLYDDRSMSAGEKLMEADLIGIPWRLVVSPQTGEKVEVKARSEDARALMSIQQFLKLLTPNS
ncbi:MAG: aminoacyl--tRNA ligase-related protein [Patescibacteria group bacterium]